MIKNKKMFYLLILTVIFLVVGIKIIIDKNKIYYDPMLSGKNPKIEIQKLDDNEYQIINIDEETVYIAYYKEYIDLLINNPKLAWERLADESKNNVFNNNYDKFLQYIESLDKNVLLNSSIVNFKRIDNVITVTDSMGNSFDFYENSIWDYTVKFNNM